VALALSSSLEAQTEDAGVAQPASEPAGLDPQSGEHAGAADASVSYLSADSQSKAKQKKWNFVLRALTDLSVHERVGVARDANDHRQCEEVDLPDKIDPDWGR
jgi:hypothetical protein